MSQELKMTGMVLLAAPYGEYDRRVILLTKEAGKITAFARGARRPTSSLLAATGAFNFGTFSLFEGRTAYTLAGAEIRNYFTELKSDLDGSCYGSYFMELAGYYGRENLDASEMINLLYASLRALENPMIPDILVRYIFEIRLMVINGEFPQDIARDPSLLESTRYTMQFIISTPIRSLYSFRVTDEVLSEIIRVQDRIRQRLVDTKMKSLEILEMMTGGALQKNG